MCRPCAGVLESWDPATNSRIGNPPDCITSGCGGELWMECWAGFTISKIYDFNFTTISTLYRESLWIMKRSCCFFHLICDPDLAALSSVLWRDNRINVAWRDCHREHKSQKRHKYATHGRIKWRQYAEIWTPWSLNPGLLRKRQLPGLSECHTNITRNVAVLRRIGVLKCSLKGLIKCNL